MPTLEQAIGLELKRLRESAGVTQDAVAIAAQRYGLQWTQATIAALELGRRNLSFGELALLPLVLSEADVTGGLVLAPAELVPATDEDVDVGPGLQLPLRIIRGLLGRETEDKAAASAAPVPMKPPPVIGEVERKAARKLGVTPEEVVEAAQRKWQGRTMTAQRDAIYQRRSRGALAAGAADDPEWARREQRRLGAITRDLIRELRPRVSTVRRRQAGKKRSRA